MKNPFKIFFRKTEKVEITDSSPNDLSAHCISTTDYLSNKSENESKYVLLTPGKYTDSKINNFFTDELKKIVGESLNYSRGGATIIIEKDFADDLRNKIDEIREKIKVKFELEKAGNKVKDNVSVVSEHLGWR